MHKRDVDRRNSRLPKEFDLARTVVKECKRLNGARRSRALREFDVTSLAGPPNAPFAIHLEPRVVNGRVETIGSVLPLSVRLSDGFQPPNGQPHYFYIMHHPQSPWIKIGTSCDPWRRVKEVRLPESPGCVPIVAATQPLFGPDASDAAFAFETDMRAFLRSRVRQGIDSFKCSVAEAVLGFAYVLPSALAPLVNLTIHDVPGIPAGHTMFYHPSCTASAFSHRIVEAMRAHTGGHHPRRQLWADVHILVTE